MCLYRDATNSNIEKIFNMHGPNKIWVEDLHSMKKKRKQRIIIILFVLYNKLLIIAY